MSVEALFTRERSVAEAIEGLIGSVKTSFDAALYRFNGRRIARALEEASQRGVQIRLVIDQGKYEESQSTQDLLEKGKFAFRLSRGRGDPDSKMHHKFALLDDSLVLTGSYNWTRESEEENYDNLVVLGEPEVAKVYRQEFELLWNDAKQIV